MRSGSEHYKAPTRHGESSDTVVYVPYPWGGCPDRHRYEQISALSGFDVITDHAPGTGRAHIDRTTRQALRPENLSKLANREADRVNEMIGSYATRIVLGDSIRGVLAIKMQLTPARPFTHVLARDAVRPHFPKQPFGMQDQSLAQRLHTGACAAAEASAYRALFRPTAGSSVTSSTWEVVQLARQIDTPFFNVMIDCDNPTAHLQAEEFSAQLRAIRRDEIMGAERGLRATALGAIVEPGWRPGALRSPHATVKHLMETLALAR